MYNPDYGCSLYLLLTDIFADICKMIINIVPDLTLKTTRSENN